MQWYCAICVYAVKIIIILRLDLWAPLFCNYLCMPLHWSRSSVHLRGLVSMGSVFRLNKQATVVATQWEAPGSATEQDI